MGAIVAVIGLGLAGVAAGMAGLLPAEGQTPDSKTIIISITTLAVTVLGSVLFRGFLAIIPILIGVLVGYALSFAMEIGRASCRERVESTKLSIFVVTCYYSQQWTT